MGKKEYCMTHPALASYADSAFSEIRIHGVEYDACESYLYISRICWESATYHRVKVRDGVYGSTFRVNGITYRTDEAVRIF